MTGSLICIMSTKKFNYSRFIHAFVASFSLLDFNREGVLLVTAHVGITHEVEYVFVGAGRGSREVQFHFRLGLQCQSLDGDQAVRRTGGLKRTAINATAVHKDMN